MACVYIVDEFPLSCIYAVNIYRILLSDVIDWTRKASSLCILGMKRLK